MRRAGQGHGVLESTRLDPFRTFRIDGLLPRMTHSMTSSACASSIGGTVRPSALGPSWASGGPAGKHFPQRYEGDGDGACYRNMEATTGASVAAPCTAVLRWSSEDTNSICTNCRVLLPCSFHHGPLSWRASGLRHAIVRSDPHRVAATQPNNANASITANGTVRFIDTLCSAGALRVPQRSSVLYGKVG
jgi:hypothetical protein